MNAKIPRVVLCFLIGLIAVATFQLTATPNSAPYSYIRGDGISEAIGDFSQLEILQEHLNFDLRSLKNREHPQITATYQVLNSGQPVEIDLLFVAPGSEKASVSLDGATIPFTTILEPNLPREWQVPWDMHHLHNYEKAFRFMAPFPTGVSELRVSYAMEPSTDGKGFYRDYYIAYILAPAKGWKAFGTLDIKVELPPDWRLAIAPIELEQTNNTFTGKFDGIPADNLMLSAKPPIPEHLETFKRINNLTILISGVLPLLGFFGCCYLAWRTAVLCRRLHWGLIRGTLAVIFLMLLDSFIFIFEFSQVNNIITFNVQSWLLEQQQGIPYYSLYLEHYYSYHNDSLIFVIIFWYMTLLATPIVFGIVRQKKCNKSGVTL